MSIWKKITAAVIAASLLLGGYVFVQIRALTAEQVTDDLYVLYGLGGNVGVLKTSEGTVIIDSMTFRYQGDRIKKIAEQLTGIPVSMIINTHYHFDHTHGNPAFDFGTRVIATNRTKHHLLQTDSEYFAGAEPLMPNETFDDSKTLNLGDKTLQLLHPGPGHTDGDLVVFMVEDKTVHTGDLYFYKHYPNIDLEAGGSVQAWSGSIDKIMALDFDRVIPGHGPVTGREGLRQFQAFMGQLADIGNWSRSQNISLEETLKTDRLTEDANYEPLKLVIPIGLDRDFVLRRAWEETHGAFELRP